jgi:hypothetical protein
LFSHGFPTILHANTDQPENQQDQWYDRQKKYFWSTHESDYSFLCQERPRGNEEPKAHAPKMSRNSLGTVNTATHEHANVTGGSK